MQLLGCLHLLNFWKWKASWEDPSFEGFERKHLWICLIIVFPEKLHHESAPQPPSAFAKISILNFCAIHLVMLCAIAIFLACIVNIKHILLAFSYEIFHQKNAAQIAKVNLKPCTESDGRKGRQSCEIKFHAKTKSAVEKKFKTSHNKKFQLSISLTHLLWAQKTRLDMA